MPARFPSRRSAARLEPQCGIGIPLRIRNSSFGRTSAPTYFRIPFSQVAGEVCKNFILNDEEISRGSNEK